MLLTVPHFGDYQGAVSWVSEILASWFAAQLCGTLAL
jgi:hypothetical protein